MQIEVTLNDPEFLAGVVVARGVRVAPAPPELAGEIDALLARLATEEAPAAAVKEAVRQMLRKGGFKPAGRNKPASEYLAQAARERRFPRINNLVDVNNLLSLECGLPISLLDLDAVGEAAEVRYGQPGERYMFNSVGQEIELAGLVCVCRRGDGGAAGAPLGNPIKDSMAGKIKDATSSVIGIIYAATQACDAPTMGRLLDRFGDLLRRHAGATETRAQLLVAGR